MWVPVINAIIMIVLVNGVAIKLMEWTTAKKEVSKIEVSIRDATVNEPIGNATIHLTVGNVTLIGQTDSSGNVRLQFSGTTGPAYASLAVKREGYQPFERVVSVPANQYRIIVPLIPTQTLQDEERY